MNAIPSRGASFMPSVSDHEIAACTDQALDSYQGALGGLTRREFLTYCTGIAATLGLSSMMGIRIAEAATAPKRPPVIWLSAQECTGCTESLLRAYHPTLETLILDMISLDYHEALCAGAGHQAEAFKVKSMQENQGKYILIVDGAIPTKDGGVYCMVAGRPILEVVREAAEGAAAIIGIGSCASWGGIPSSDPNPTGAKSVQAVLHGKTVINIPGCPPNPYNFLSTVLYLLTFGKPPALDSQEPAQIRLRAADPRKLRAAAPFRCRPFCPGIRRFRSPPGLLSLQARLQGAGNLRQLPDHRLRRCRRRQLAGRDRSSLLRLHRTGRWFHQAAAFAG
jgi:coenzyme F420-reducing hydrogenase gamma subunit